MKKDSNVREYRLAVLFVADIVKAEISALIEVKFYNFFNIAATSLRSGETFVLSVTFAAAS